MTTTAMTCRESLEAALIHWHDRYCGPRMIYTVRVVTWTAVAVSSLWLCGFFHAP